MQIHVYDNVGVGADGQKYALKNIGKGENIIKYGFPIGHAKTDIKEGEFVGPVNIASNLSGIDEWTYTPYTE